MRRFLIVFSFSVVLFGLSSYRLSFQEAELFTVTLFVTDDYSQYNTPPKYCTKVPIIINEKLLYSGDKIKLKKGTYKVTPVVRSAYWVEGYESELILQSDTLLSITLYVVD